MMRQYLNEIDLSKRILEIGPLCSPMVPKNGSNKVFYADIRTTEEVKKFYQAHPIDHAGICDIDYVIKNSYRETFSNVEKFDYVLMSHVIEHVPELIFFLQDAATIIKPNGLLCLTIPDHRYCFDHFRTPTSFAEVYDIYKRGIKNNPIGTLDFFANAIPCNDPVFFWSEQDKTVHMPSMGKLDKALNIYEDLKNDKTLDIDVHFSVFTPGSFLMLLYHMTMASLVPFKCVRFQPTQPNTFEFNVVLQLEQSLMDSPSLKQAELDNIISLIRRNNYEEVKLRDHTNELKNRFEGLEQHYEELKNNYEELNNNYNTITNSTFWLLTKPLRVVCDYLKTLYRSA